MNAFFDKYVNSSTTLKQFVEQYDVTLKSKIENESIADFSSFTSTIPLISDFEFEKQFQSAYTHDMFREFQAEIGGMLYCNVSYIGSDGHTSTYQVYDVSKGKDGTSKTKVYNVLSNEHKFEVLSQCHFFEFKGIICRHILKVLIAKNVTQVTSEYILDHWRKDIKRSHNFVRNCYEDFDSPEEQVRQDSLFYLSNKISEMAIKSDDMYEFAKKKLEELHEDMVNHECNTTADEEDSACMTIRSPLQVCRKGRPPSKRLESNRYKSSGNKGRKSVGAFDVSSSAPVSIFFLFESLYSRIKYSVSEQKLW
ncbi:hypothetical protein L1049_025431 [Liquidambar formosana]|uniref:Protein FAR1-RELATED SEQUENCE n=1 Tax=Liquidambar formosana TaxID=63359 RepID=A0AAP0NBU5_LIQFO